MTDTQLQARRILVVEDEFLIASDLCSELEDALAVVLGPVGSVEDALALIASGEAIDGAVLDLNLGGEKAYPVADALSQRNVPFVFATGYDAAAIPERFSGVDRCEKPVDISVLRAMIGRAITG